MTDLHDWRSLRGADLEQAILAARWWVQPNDVIGGWSITVTDDPHTASTAGVAEVGA